MTVPGIARITTRLVERVVRPELAITSAAGAHAVSQYVLVRVEDGDGRAGWGEATVVPIWSGETQESARVIIENHFAPVLLGRDVADVEGAAKAMDRAAVGNPFAKAAVEMALWDLRGRIDGQPLWKTLYPAVTEAKPIPVRGSISAADPAGAQARAGWFLEQGLRAVKAKVGVGGVAADVARVRAVREVVGESMPLGVDANGGWSVEEAVAAIRALESVGIQYAEQPVARGDFAGMRAVRNRVGIPLMADETVWTSRDVETLLHFDAADIVSLYPGKMGGLTRCLEIATRLADAGKMPYIGSNLELDLGTSAMAHLAVALPGADFDHWHSDIIGTLYYERTLTDPPLRPVDGVIAPPIGPGLGISLGGGQEAI